MNKYYRLEWEHNGVWVKIGTTTDELEEIVAMKQLLTERAFADGRADKFRIIRVTEEEMIG